MRLDQYTKTKMQEHAAAFFLRLQHTNPFPAIRNDVVPDIRDPIFNTYLSCLPEHIRNAVLLLMADDRYIDFLDMNTSSSLIVKAQQPDKSEGLVDVSVRFNFSTRRPSSTHWRHKAELAPDHPMREKIIQWIYRAKEINQDYARCLSYIVNIIDYANTAGQLRTMFPDYVHMLPEAQQQHIFKMQKRSPLPKDVDKEYLIAHRQFVAEKAALCLLLPEGGEKIWLG